MASVLLVVAVILQGAAVAPDVLIMDIGVPREHGYTLLRRVRKLRVNAGGAVPAISLTAHARDKDRTRALAAGFQRHLPKRIDVPSLVAAIDELIPPPSAAAQSSRA